MNTRIMDTARNETKRIVDTARLMIHKNQYQSKERNETNSKERNEKDCGHSKAHDHKDLDQSKERNETNKTRNNEQRKCKLQRRRPTSKGEANEEIGSVRKRKQGGLDKKD